MTGFILVVVSIMAGALVGPQRSSWPGVLWGLTCVFVLGQVSRLLARQFHTAIIWPLLGGGVIFLGFFASLLVVVGPSLDPY